MHLELLYNLIEFFYILRIYFNLEEDVNFCIFVFISFISFILSIFLFIFFLAI